MCLPPKSLQLQLLINFLFCYLTMLSEWKLYSIDDKKINECGVVGGMRFGRGSWNTRRKASPVPLCPPQIPHDFVWNSTLAAVIRSWLLTAWAMARLTTLTQLIRDMRQFPRDIALNDNPSLRSNLFTNIHSVSLRNWMNIQACNRMLRYNIIYQCLPYFSKKSSFIESKNRGNTISM
jgi:hypothetical protein